MLRKKTDFHGGGIDLQGFFVGSNVLTHEIRAALEIVTRCCLGSGTALIHFLLFLVFEQLDVLSHDDPRADISMNS